MLALGDEYVNDEDPVHEGFADDEIVPAGSEGMLFIVIELELTVFVDQHVPS
jgi:hypothetical protein